MEAIAYEFQARFENRQPLLNVVETVQQHAISARDAAAVVFGQNGIEIRE